MEIKEMRFLSGMTQKAFSHRLQIPKRTIENWESGQRSCPQYLLFLIEYYLVNEGLISKQSGDRTPSPNARDAIAQALDISPASLKDRQLTDLNDCIHTLFDLEDTGILDSEVFQGILAQWKEKQQQLKAGAISFNEYRLWKMQFKAEK